MTKRRRRRTQPRRLPVTTSPREGWGIALEVGGVVQSVSGPESSPDDAPAPRDAEPRPGPGGGYWGLLLPPGCPGRALLLGLGAGTVAQLLARRCPDTALVGVERDPEVLVVAREAFALDGLARLEVVEADAFTWVAEHALSVPGTFDLICLDLFEAGRLAPGAPGTPVLRPLAAPLAPAGTLTLHLIVTARTPQHVQRLRRVLTLTPEPRLRGHLV